MGAGYGGRRVIIMHGHGRRYDSDRTVPLSDFQAVLPILTSCPHLSPRVLGPPAGGDGLPRVPPNITDPPHLLSTPHPQVSWPPCLRKRSSEGSSSHH